MNKCSLDLMLLGIQTAQEKMGKVKTESDKCETFLKMQVSSVFMIQNEQKFRLVLRILRIGY